MQNSSVYDVDGDQIGKFKAAENQRSVGEDDLGEYLPRAVVAVEDRRFYEHYGVDFAGAVFARCPRGSQAWEASRGVGSRLLGLLVGTLVVGVAAPALTRHSPYRHHRSSTSTYCMRPRRSQAHDAPSPLGYGSVSA